MSSKRSPNNRLRVPAPLLALGLLATAAASGQTQVLPIPRVLNAVDAAQTVPLKGSVLPLAQARFDRGAVPDATPTGHMMIVLKRSDEQEQALKQLLTEQQDPKSSNYHKWLTPEGFGAQFGVSDSDVQAVSGYLSEQGFSVGRIFKNKMAIEFSGTTGQIRSSFKTEIHTYVVNGQTFHANASAAQIPSALAPVVRGFASMSDYKTPTHASQPMVLNRETRLAHPLYSVQDPNNPTAGQEAVSPGDLAVIYDIPTATYNGTGVTVGIVSDSNINIAIPANYRTTFGLTANPPTVIIDGNDPGITADADLSYAQIELVAATAPAAKVNFYTSATTQMDTGINFATIRALEDNAVQVLVFGYEQCEANLGADNTLFYLTWQQAAAQGISVVVGAGSGGAAGCDAAIGGAQPVTQATHGLAVNGYASTEWDTAVGASDFYYGPTGSINPSNPGPAFYQYWSQTNGGTAGYTSALKYIPEQPSNSSYQATNQETPTSVVFASGGGASTAGVVNSDGTQTPYLKPYYQSGFGGPFVSSKARTIPDVSFFGGSLNNGSAYVLCISASDCVNGTPDTLQFTDLGGSGVSAAAFGGVAALIVQAKGVQGSLNPGLYATYTAAGPNGGSVFHDITAGTNAVECTGGSPDCIKRANGVLYTGTGGAFAYSSRTGYDAASGLGSVDVKNLISNWTTPQGAATVTLSLTTPGTTTPVGGFHHGDPVQLNVTVTGGAVVPTGTVAITTSNTQPQPSTSGIEALTLANGTAVDSAIGNLLPGSPTGKSYQLVARYGGDANHAPAMASIPVSVYQIASALQVLTADGHNNPLPQYTGQTLNYGSQVQISFQVYSPQYKNDGGTPTGSITVYDNGNKVAIVPLDADGYATFATTTLAPGSHSFSATYSGDNTYSNTSLTAGYPSLKIGGVATTITLATTDSSVSRNSTFALIATVTPTGGTSGAAPGGTVQFKTTTGSLLGSVALNLGMNSGTNPSSSAVFSVKRALFAAGTYTIVATYIPDSTGNYTAGPASNGVTVAIGAGAGLVNTTLKVTTTPVNEVNFLNTSAVTFNAAVTPASGAAATGSVTFYSSSFNQPNPAPLGTATLDSTGVATLSGVVTLPLGQSSVTAQYTGDGTHASSVGSYTVNVYAPGTTPDFSMQADPTFQTITASSTTADYTVQFTSLNGFAANGTAIALSYTTPASFTCSSAPTAPAFNGGTYAPVTVTCGPAPGYTVAMLNNPNPHLLWMAEGGTALACIFLFGMPSRRRSWQSLIGTMALVLVAFGVTGCGANFASVAAKNISASTDQVVKTPDGVVKPQVSGVILPGTYTVIVTGTARVFVRSQPNVTVTVVHNLPLKIVVQ